ncbi:hypothetical protein AVEN_106635-1 [Araneus ventricosus]|uniref:Uncharacterized protein n=1 Tax=Araneus ventricosus TaxID=182803 RepID=A0A4Y2H903_ARAVE|nr:hypothetical protein AVEN_106635-1 [Araneus ventricosus]
MIPRVTARIVVWVYCPVGCHVLKDVRFPVRQVICDSFSLREVCGYYPTVLHTPEVVYGFCVTLAFITSNDQIGQSAPGLIVKDNLLDRTINSGLK